MIIGGRKVVALFDDMTGGGTSRFALAGNDTMPQPWAVLHLHRVDGGEPRLIGTQPYGTSEEARRAFLNRAAQYIPAGLSADPRFF